MQFVSKTGYRELPSLLAEKENHMDLLIVAGEIDLAAAVHLPGKVPAPVIVCSHGLLSSKESPKFIAIGEQMSKAGFCVLRFDFSGCGNSPPRRALSLVEARKSDLAAAMGFALEQPWSDGRIGLLGSSFGGFLSLIAADERPELIRATVSWAAPFDISNIHPDTEHFEDLRTIVPERFSLGSPKNLSALGEAARVLLIHGQLDEIVPWNNSFRIYERLNDPKKLMLMRTADHQVSDEAWRKRAIQASLEWFVTYLR
ncbi:MAG: alpha/beta hydrolase family protein [Syntrophobacteraceae bacterium]